MFAFDDIKPGSRLRGLDAAGIAEVVQVSRFGADALNLVFRVQGRVAERLVYRGEEKSFELVEAGRAYAFDADGGLPVSKTRPPVPLLGGAAGCRAVPNRRRMPARTAAIPHQHDVRRCPRDAWPHVRPRPVGVRRNRRNDRERPGQSRPKNVHIGFSCEATGSAPAS
jgi:hypothetical protein